MILVDPRVGSKELYGILSGNSVDVCMSPTELIAGDFCFEGNGPNNTHYLIGVERKTVRDMLSSINTGRFSGHQLPLLTQMYDRYYLVVEGVYGCGKDGLLEEPRGNGQWWPIELKGRRFMHSMLERFLISVEESSGIRVHRTYNTQDTGKHIIHLWHVWNDKAYEKHRAGTGKVDTHVEVNPWSLKRRLARELPGVGDEWSKAADDHFESVQDMIMASETEWAGVQVTNKDKKTKFGKARAKRLIEAIDIRNKK